MAFWNKKITSDEYADLSAKIVKLNNEVLMLQATVERMELRVKGYHTKLARIKEEEEEEEVEDEQLDEATVQRRLLGIK